ncbi:hypothetical protein IV417_06510 [Alphaproteobacteria bacterium KMM 3653]|uniref:Uncharacterized protein n=1 Tax=Harenicola maris TaxID=2841044 RepID=A0AAP2G807_9RHOB|nr:hypothetical protein [Harenicola maris]
MAHPHQVLRSINLPGEAVCVDIFRRGDGTFGFDQFRRDPEDGRGWYTISYFGDRVYTSEAEALRDAALQVPWLGPLI